MKAKAYAALGWMEIRSLFAFLPDVLVSLSFFAVVMFVFVQLWETTYAAAGEAVINGYTFPEMLWYLVATEAIVLTMPRTHRNIAAEVRSGDIAIRLLRPLSYLGMHWSQFLAGTLFRFLVGISVGGATTWLLVGPPPLTHASAVVALPLLFLVTFSLHFCVSATVGLCAFWVEDISGLWLVVDKVKWVLGGLLMPIEVFPGWLKAVAEVLPFRHMLHAPARLFVRFSWEQAGEVLVMQMLWLVALGGMLAAVHRVALRRLAANGG